MLVTENLVDGKSRLDYKYKIQSGPSKVKGYGLALARNLRFPTSLVDRAEEILTHIEEVSLINISKRNKEPRGSGDQSDTLDTSTVSTAMAALDKDVIDLYSHVLLLVSSYQQEEHMNIISQKLKDLTEKMTPEFREFVSNSPLEQVLDALNASKLSN